MGVPTNKPPLREEAAAAPSVSIVRGSYEVEYVWHVPVDLRNREWYVKYGALHVVDNDTGRIDHYLPVVDHDSCDFKHLTPPVYEPDVVLDASEIATSQRSGDWGPVDQVKELGLSRKVD